MIRLRRDSNAIAQIRFTDKYVPPLGAGDFTVTAKQDLAWTGGNRSYPVATQKLRVDAPRFVLPEGDVESFYPPATNGIFNESMPNIAFFEPALPWERDLGPGIPRTTHPWLALLLFTEDEVIGDGDPKNETRRIKRKVRDVVTPPAGTCGPKLQCDAAELDTDCFTIDITQQTFAALVPFKDDLPYLAHCRKVDVSGKITEILGDGWFSVIVANRVPPQPQTKRNHIVHLVSLEGFGAMLEPSRVWPPAGITNVRMVSLHSWAFVCEPAKGDFNGLALSMVRNATAGGEELRLRAPSIEGNDQAKRAIAQGYVPVGYDTRSGESTFAWYHGPLVPNPIQAFTPSAQWPPPTADAALIYDDASGTFDVSYATAWQLGRLIALSSRIYAGDMARLRQRVKRSVNRLRERGGVRLLAASANDASNDSLNALLDPQYEKNALMDWMGSSGSSAFLGVPRGAATLGHSEEPEAPEALRGAPRDPVDETQRLTAHPQVQRLMANVAREALSSEPGSRIPDWESKLRLLRGIPFAHLVPDARMLPIDSIRFFYIDNNWIDALLAGTRSVGVDSTRAFAEQQVVLSVIHEAAHDRALAHRPLLLGNDAPPRNDANAGPAVTGFLLRSAMVAGWDGLEIEGFRAGRTEKVNLVRSDRLGDVLLALFDDRIDRVSIAEPKEVLAFGIRNDSVAMRRVTGNVAEVLGRKTIGPEFRRESGVLKIAEWQDALRRDPKLNLTPAQWGSAAFALQMIRAPLKITFYNPLSPEPAS